MSQPASPGVLVVGKDGVTGSSPAAPARHHRACRARGRTEALQRLDAFVAEIGSATWDGGRGFTWADGARRFESWEKSYVNIVGLGAAVRQALQLGADAIGARTARLGARLRGQLNALPTAQSVS
jgi:selenocysteine lyase/cysteine desulfurase